MKLSRIIAVFLLPTLLYSQDYKKDILEVSKYFTSIKNYSMIMHYKLFLDGNLSRPFQEREVTIKRANKNLLMQQNNGLETMDNGTYQIVVNNKNKVFSARKKQMTEESSENLSEFTSYLASNLDSMLLMYEKIRMIENKEGKVTYELILKANETTEKVTVVIDKAKKMFYSMTIKYKQAVRVDQLDGKPHVITLQINYKDFKPNSVSSGSLFDEKNFITVGKDGKISAVKKYANYRLIIPNEDI